MSRRMSQRQKKYGKSRRSSRKSARSDDEERQATRRKSRMAPVQEGASGMASAGSGGGAARVMAAVRTVDKLEKLRAKASVERQKSASKRKGSSLRARQESRRLTAKRQVNLGPTGAPIPAAARGAGATGGAGASAAAAPAGVSDAWVRMVFKGRQPYWFNKTTGKTQWTRPAGVRDPDKQAVARVTGRSQNV